MEEKFQIDGPLFGKPFKELEEEASVPPSFTVDDYEYPSGDTIPLDSVRFGYKPDLVEEGYFRPFFTIGVQTFSLTAVESKEHAEWYVKMMKIAFAKLKQ